MHIKQALIKSINFISVVFLKYKNVTINSPATSCYYSYYYSQQQLLLYVLYDCSRLEEIERRQCESQRLGHGNATRASLYLYCGFVCTALFTQLRHNIHVFYSSVCTTITHYHYTYLSIVAYTYSTLSLLYSNILITPDYSAFLRGPRTCIICLKPHQWKSIMDLFI